MHCLVLRHAPAEPGSPDAERPLTPRGERRAAHLARHLALRLPDIGCVATSPLRRAVQTAEPLARRLGLEPLTLPALAPGGWRELWDWLPQAGTQACVVGHAPDLDQFVCHALCGRIRPFVALKKGGAALLDFGGPIKPGHAVLQWLLTPRLTGPARR